MWSAELPGALPPPGENDPRLLASSNTLDTAFHGLNE